MSRTRALHPIAKGLHQAQKAPLLFVGAHVCLLVFEGTQLARFASTALLPQFFDAAFAFLGFLLISIGLPLFWGLQGTGWVLLFLGHATWILHVMRNLLISETLEHFSMTQHLGAVFIHLVLLRLMLLPKVYNLYASPLVKHWMRASRHPIEIRGTLSYASRLLPAVLQDVSTTGCLFAVEKEIVLGEVGYFKADNDTELELLEIQIIRKADSEAGLPTPHQQGSDGYRYGAKFMRKITAPTLHRLHKAGTQG